MTSKKKHPVVSIFAVRKCINKLPQYPSELKGRLTCVIGDSPLWGIAYHTC